MSDSLRNFLDWMAVRFHCLQLCASQNLFAFLIVTLCHFLAEQFLLEMVDVVFTAQHLQLQLTM